MDVTYDLAVVPGRAVAHTDVAHIKHVHGRTSLRVALSEDMTRYRDDDGGSVDLPTFVSLPICFEDVALEVDVWSRLYEGASPAAAPLAGLAYRVSNRDRRSRQAEVRPLNGPRHKPPTAWTRRAAQFVTYQQWPFDSLQPPTPSTGSAPGLDQWTRVSVQIDGTRLVALVDGDVSLVIPVNRAAAPRGDIGLFVDVGTEAYFSNLRVTPS
ncbi:MAG: hypothetical protein ACYC1E_07385 [Propionibacteriaceae bacterium]